jgi:excisionase family DNA binding protein
MDAPEKLLSPREVADWLGVSISWVREHTTRYHPIIPHIRMGRAVRFRREDIERFLAILAEKSTADN